MYGGPFRSYLHDFLEHEHESAHRIHTSQLQKLNAVITKAVQDVPFYRSRKSEYLLGDQKLDMEKLKQLPLLKKQVVKENSHLFISDRARLISTFDGRTSGTTGTPLTIKTSYDALRRTWAAMERLRFWGGVSRFHRRASLTGKLFVPTNVRQQDAFWRYDWIGKRILLSVYHLNEQTVPQYIKAISRFKPAFIDGYPSAMHFLAKYLMEHPSERVSSLVAAFPTAETLTREVRADISAGLNVQVYNQYGSTELSCHAGECNYGTMHISPEIGIVELLDDNGQEAKPGEVGNIVVTGLVNDAMPLIRYQIGDMAVVPLQKRTCICLRRFPVIGEIVGRSDDLIRTPDGRRLPIMNYHVFKVAGGVKEAQLIQDDYFQFRMIVVPESGKEPDLRKSIDELTARLGYKVYVKVEVRDILVRTAAGKLRSVISHVV